LGDEELPGLVRSRIVGRVDDNDYGAHLGVNVAENVDDPRAVERHAVRGSRLIEAEVEALSIEHGKDIVKERIEIGEVDDGARGNRQDVGVKPFVILEDLVSRRGSSAPGVGPYWLERDYGVCVIGFAGGPAGLSNNGNGAGHRHGLRLEGDAEDDCQEERYSHDIVSPQNTIPELTLT
jgi:hypothetical protein